MKEDRFEDRYSIHPLVHEWIRERPEMSASQQALWCQIAATTLSRSILFPPPLGDTEVNRSMRRQLRQHINHIQQCQESINKRLKENRTRRNRWLPAVHSTFDRHRAQEAARYSRVYSECGDYEHAKELQSKVRDFVIRTLGEDHTLSILAGPLLARNLYDLSRVSESTVLQRRIHQVCVASLGEDHWLTLRVTDQLGSILWFQGRWAESLALHQRAVEGMTRIYGKDHKNTLKALDHQARVIVRNLDYEKAAELYLKAWEGLKWQLGELHFDTLEVLEDLAICRIRLDAKYLPESHEQMMLVVDQRRKVLGKEHPYTLLAICSLGRVKSAMG